MLWLMPLLQRQHIFLQHFRGNVILLRSPSTNRGSNQVTLWSSDKLLQKKIAYATGGLVWTQTSRLIHDKYFDLFTDGIYYYLLCFDSLNALSST